MMMHPELCEYWISRGHRVAHHCNHRGLVLGMDCIEPTRATHGDLRIAREIVPGEVLELLWRIDGDAAVLVGDPDDLCRCFYQREQAGFAIRDRGPQGQDVAIAGRRPGPTH